VFRKKKARRRLVLCKGIEFGKTPTVRNLKQPRLSLYDYSNIL